jgi:hypothetical protein
LNDPDLALALALPIEVIPSPSSLNDPDLLALVLALPIEIIPSPSLLNDPDLAIALTLPTEHPPSPSSLNSPPDPALALPIELIPSPSSLNSPPDPTLALPIELIPSPSSLNDADPGLILPIVVLPHSRSLSPRDALAPGVPVIIVHPGPLFWITTEADAVLDPGPVPRKLWSYLAMDVVLVPLTVRQVSLLFQVVVRGPAHILEIPNPFFCPAPIVHGHILENAQI